MNKLTTLVGILLAGSLIFGTGCTKYVKNAKQKHIKKNISPKQGNLDILPYKLKLKQNEFDMQPPEYKLKSIKQVKKSKKTKQADLITLTSISYIFRGISHHFEDYEEVREDHPFFGLEAEMEYYNETYTLTASIFKNSHDENAGAISLMWKDCTDTKMKFCWGLSSLVLGGYNELSPKSRGIIWLPLAGYTSTEGEFNLFGENIKVGLDIYYAPEAIVGFTKIGLNMEIPLNPRD